MGSYGVVGIVVLILTGWIALDYHWHGAAERPRGGRRQNTFWAQGRGDHMSDHVLPQDADPGLGALPLVEFIPLATLLLVQMGLGDSSKLARLT